MFYNDDGSEPIEVSLHPIDMSHQFPDTEVLGGSLDLLSIRPHTGMIHFYSVDSYATEDDILFSIYINERDVCEFYPNNPSPYIVNDPTIGLIRTPTRDYGFDVEVYDKLDTQLLTPYFVLAVNLHTQS